MTADGLQIYVYYRVQPADVAAATAAVRQLQAELMSALPGLRCSLSQRVESGAELLTLMETYAHPTGLADAWPRELEGRATLLLARWTVGVRHVERFVPCA